MRPSSDRADALIGEKIRCLDKGFVYLVDYMGNDAAIVQAARVSYGAGTKSVREDRGLIRYLMRHAHTTPFEMVKFKFHVRLPIFLARQWMRHRMGSFNEHSGRYSIMSEDFYLPNIEDITAQSKDNKQGGSQEQLIYGRAWQAQFKNEQEQAYERYESRLNENMRRELARINLPVANYTEFYWSTDLHNLMHFLRLRLDSHAQLEIREYGSAIASIVKLVCPLAWEAFEDYRLNSITLSDAERITIAMLLHAQIDPERALADPEWTTCKINGQREKAEFMDKLRRILEDNG